MRLKHVEILLFFMFIIRQITANKNTELSRIINDMKAKNIKPLIIVLGAKGSKNNKEVKDVLDFDTNSADEDYPNAYYTGDNGGVVEDDNFENVYEDTAGNKAKYLLYSYLLRTGPTPQNVEEMIEEEKKNLLRSALRARCQARVQCEKKCESEEKTYCPRNCKAIFDNLNLCEPPKQKPCKKEDPCAKKGRTMPPAWRF